MKRGLSVPAAVAALVSGMVAAVVTAPAASAVTISTQTLLAQLVVAREHPLGYERSLFPLWVDADGDGCDARDEVLIAEATSPPQIGAGCDLSTGGSWFSKYDGVTTTDPSTFDIDHLVPLAEAWQSGAWRWDTDTRMRYANDLGYPADLIAVSAHSNRSKGEREPQDWMPDRTSFRCRYVAWWVAVKWRWRLKVNQVEKTFLSTELATCGWPSVARPSRPPITSSGGHVGSGATGGVRITSIYFDPPGSDDGSNGSLNGEWVAIKNTTTRAKLITGWTLRDSASHVYQFPSVTLAAGARAKVHTGSGTDTPTNLYWQSTSYIWNNGGDTAELRNASAQLVDHCTYTSSAAPQARC